MFKHLFAADHCHELNLVLVCVEVMIMIIIET